MVKRVLASTAQHSTADRQHGNSSPMGHMAHSRRSQWRSAGLWGRGGDAGGAELYVHGGMGMLGSGRSTSPYPSMLARGVHWVEDVGTIVMRPYAHGDCDRC